MRHRHEVAKNLAGVYLCGLVGRTGLEPVTNGLKEENSLITI